MKLYFLDADSLLLSLGLSCSSLIPANSRYKSEVLAEYKLNVDTSSTNKQSSIIWFLFAFCGVGV
jgi:hypothetical protein